MAEKKKLTTTAGKRGPMLMQDVWFQEKLGHFDNQVKQ
jgi:catalase